MSKFAVFCLKEWPIVNLKLSGSPEDSEEFEDYLKWFEMLYEKGRKFKLMVDTSDIGSISYYYISRQAFHMYNNEHNTEKYIKKVGLVIKSEYVTNLLQTLLQWKEPKCEIKIFEDKKNCKEWLEKI